jgi:hypothetical protein
VEMWEFTMRRAALPTARESAELKRRMIDISAVGLLRVMKRLGPTGSEGVRFRRWLDASMPA